MSVEESHEVRVREGFDFWRKVNVSPDLDPAHALAGDRRIDESDVRAVIRRVASREKERVVETNELVAWRPGTHGVEPFLEVGRSLAHKVRRSLRKDESLDLVDPLVLSFDARVDCYEWIQIMQSS